MEFHCSKCGQRMELDALMTAQPANETGDPVYVCKNHPTPFYVAVEGGFETTDRGFYGILPEQPNSEERMI